MGRRWPVAAFLVALVLAGPQALADEHDGRLLPSLSEEEEEITLFVMGNTAFTLFHEVGHALVDLLALPIVGREEDAVDGFATVMMIPDPADPLADPLADALILAAADGWLFSADQQS